MRNSAASPFGGTRLSGFRVGGSVVTTMLVVAAGAACDSSVGARGDDVDTDESELRALPSYLDDADSVVPPAAPVGVVDTAALPFPRVGLTERTGIAKMTVAARAKYDVLNGHRQSEVSAAVLPARGLNPSLIALRQFSPRAWQSDALGDSVPFTSTGVDTDVSSGAMYAGHWLYYPGTRLEKSIGAGETRLLVRGADSLAHGFSKTSGVYAVIYDGGPGAFENAEHVFVRAIDSATGAVTVERGYRSKAVAHAADAVIAEHVANADGIASMWAYNHSRATEKAKNRRDASGASIAERMAEWLAGEATPADADGIMFDADPSTLAPVSPTYDFDNDLVVDPNWDSGGTSPYLQGLEDFYTRLRAALAKKGKTRVGLIVGGADRSRGFGQLNGDQEEELFNDVDAENFGEKLARYRFRVRRYAVGPAYTEVLFRKPTQLYPNCATKGVPGDNRSFRLALGMALLDDGFLTESFECSSADAPDMWYDELAVDTRDGSATFGQAAASEADRFAWRHWLGKPLGRYHRQYDPAALGPSLLDGSSGAGSFERELSAWSAKNASLSRSTASAAEGSSSLTIGRQASYSPDLTDTTVSTSVVLPSAGTYTLSFAVRADRPRELTVVFGSVRSKIFADERWQRVVLNAELPAGGANVALLLGQEDTAVGLDSVYLFNGATNVFRRNFERGAVVVNGTSAPVTVHVGPRYRRLLGSGAQLAHDTGSPNTGEVMDGSLTIPPLDAILLVKRY